MDDCYIGDYCSLSVYVGDSNDGGHSFFDCSTLATIDDKYLNLACCLLLFSKMAHLVLASSSPRRRELLQQLGLNFEIYSPDIDESVHDGELVHQYVERLAREKAQAVLNNFSRFSDYCSRYEPWSGWSDYW